MASLHWARPSLGSAYEDFLGQGGTNANRTRSANADLDADWTRAVEDWKAVLSIPTNIQTAFIQTLSTSQRRSLRLLVEWWTAAYSSKSDAVDIKAHILGPDGSSQWKESADHRNDPDYRLIDIYETDGYEARLYKLWMCEFWARYDISGRLGDLQGERSLAARVAACQRVSFGALMYHTNKTRVRNSAHQELLQELENLDDGLPLGGIIEACPWLSEEQRKGLPFYLWDVVNKRTVRTSDLPEQPLYNVISHTWGRWRLEDEPDISIPGVPWPVPQNSRFAIGKLPEILADKSEQFLPARYLWFDLFCIPQDRSELSKIEISRQAAIFGGAYRAIAWLNYVDGWKGLNLALEFMVSYWLDRHREAAYRKGRQILRPSLYRQPDSNATLWPGYTYEQDTTFSEMNGQDGWFTSLWTLQELCLRPDMLLADRNWDVCHYNGSTGRQLLTIDTLAAVTWSAKPYIIEEACTKSAEGLCALVMGIGLDQLLEPHPLSALCLGSRRQCTERRAEAIMSVVGATRWYTEAEDTNRDLVLGHYPIQFLRELHERLGAMFFSANTMRSGLADILHRAVHNDSGVRVFNAGSMLPFDPWHCDARMVLDVGSSLDTTDHPSTKSWEIGDGGEVYMTEVAIVASTDEEFDEDTDPDIIATIGLPTKDSFQTTVFRGNLREALRTVYPTLMKHAVCLREDPIGGYEGIILVEIHEVIYAKLGDFSSYPSKSSAEKHELQTWEIGRWEVI
jgi:hypothetical protein